MKRLVVSLFCLFLAASFTYGKELNYQEAATVVQDALRSMDYAVMVDVKRCDKNTIADYIVAWAGGRLDEKIPFLGAVTGVVGELSIITTWKSDKVFAAITTRDFVMRRWYASTADCRKCRRMIDKGASLEATGLCIKSIWHPSGSGCPPNASGARRDTSTSKKVLLGHRRYNEAATQVWSFLAERGDPVIATNVWVQDRDKNGIVDYVVVYIGKEKDMLPTFLFGVTLAVAAASAKCDWESDKVFATIDSQEWYAYTADCRKCVALKASGRLTEHEASLCALGVWKKVE